MLEEAYRHSYEATLRATSRTFAGSQDPTFQYDFRGQEALVLTRLASRIRATLAFPEGVGFLVLSENADGPVVAETGPSGPARSLRLKPGRYFVRGRGRDCLFEGTVSVNSGETRSVRLDALRRVEHARLVRKGARTSRLAQGAELGVLVRLRLPRANGACLGPAAGYRLEPENLSLFGRLGACRSGFENRIVEATTDELVATATALHAWDLRAATLALGLGAGASLTHQQFETRGDAPDRTSVWPFVLVRANATVDVTSGVFASADVDAETHLLKVQEGSRGASELQAGVAARATVFGGMYFW